ncbi:MAG TPA: YCF48-related protein [Blastocatellia bacterium]|nr:YCF48-related protein [Blastocatellia bacterium]
MKSRSLSLLTLVILSCLLIDAASVSAARDGSSPEAAKEVRQWEVTGPWGGDVRALVASPDNSDLLYLGTSDGQIFRSTDGARTWRRLKPGLDKREISVDCIAIDPRNSKVIYVGVWPVGRDREGGIFKTEDGGESWKLLEGTTKLSVRSLAIAPSNSNFLIAGSANDDPSLNGVFRSTDAGKTWERISPIGDKEIRNIESAAIDPRDTNVLYVGTWHLPWKTTNGGVTWKQAGNQIVGMINDSDIFGINIFDASKPNLVYVNACSGIFRSVNAGEKWTKLPGIPFSARRTYALLPHPAEPSTIFAGTSEGLWRSKDGGKRWMLLTSKSMVIRSIVVTLDKPNRVLIATDDFGIRISENLGDDFIESNTGFIHRHILAIQPDASERGRILASVYHDGNGGSVFTSRDGGESWQPSSQGMAGRDVFAFYQLPDQPNVIYAGTNNGVFRSNDRGASWSFAGAEPVKKETPPRKVTKRRRALAELPVGRYQTVPTSKGKQRTQKKKAASKKPPSKKPLKKEALSGQFVELRRQVDDIAGFADSEGRRGLLAATMDGLYRTFDETKGWEKVLIGGYEPNGRVYAVSTHKDTPLKIFVGTQRGLFISNDGGHSWEQVERGPTDMYVKAIAQDPRDAAVVVIGTNQFIYRSTNGGRTWVRRGGGLPSGDFTSVVINPTNPDEVMAACYSRGGVYRSTDKGYTWERIDAELPTNRVWTLIFDPFDRNRIYAGSFSSGVYVLTVRRAATNTGQ